MSGIDDLMAGLNDRWEHAARRASGIADNGLGAAVKTYYTRYFPAGVIALIAAGTGLGILAFGGDSPGLLLYLVFGLAALGTLIGGLVYNAKKVVPAANFGRIDVLLSLEKGEQKQVRRQIAGKATIEPEHLAVVRAAAVQRRKSLATQLLLAPWYLLYFIPQSVNSALRGDGTGAWFMAIGVVALLVGIGFIVRDFLRTGRFLARTEAVH
ncbi:hypothetical protein ACSBOX_18225 [Arthrobacter sp. KN11-1C]|uniref:hypothetical protein n=1 Tax=Arthrobacter sp. KN11-1C TaxID=3445774 RepID=UPI003F9FC082